MKPFLILFFSIVFSIQCFSQAEYIIEIDGETYEIALDKSLDIEINGNLMPVKVYRKDTLLLKEEFFRFNYVKDHKISNAEVDENISQLMLMTAGGSGVIIQKYNTIDPTTLNSLMLSEVTKESVSYGYSIKREDYDLTLKSGQVLNVLKAVLEYKGEKETYEVTSYGKKDEGILIMTMEMDTGIGGGKDMIKLMWDSLHILK